MKRLSNTYFLLAFASLVIFLSCGSKTDPKPPEPTVKEKAVTNLTAQPYSGPTVTFQGSAPPGDWTNFIITFTASRYTTMGVPTGYEGVWAADGTWTLDDTATTLSRTQSGTSLDITSTISDNGVLSMTFTIPDSGGGRINDITGTWIFVFN